MEEMISLIVIGRQLKEVYGDEQLHGSILDAGNLKIFEKTCMMIDCLLK